MLRRVRGIYVDKVLKEIIVTGIRNRSQQRGSRLGQYGQQRAAQYKLAGGTGRFDARPERPHAGHSGGKPVRQGGATGLGPALLSQPVIIEVEPRENIAAGRFGWGLALRAPPGSLRRANAQAAAELLGLGGG